MVKLKAEKLRVALIGLIQSSRSQSKSDLQLLLLVPAMAVQSVLVAVAASLPSC